MKISVNQQSKGKPENKYGKFNYISKVPCSEIFVNNQAWIAFDASHPELICLTPTGELAGEGSYETDGEVTYHVESGNYLYRISELNKAVWEKDTKVISCYIVTTPANEQPKEWWIEQSEQCNDVIDAINKRLTQLQHKDFKTAEEILRKNLANGDADLGCDPSYVIDAMREYHAQFTPSPSLAPVDESVKTAEQILDEYNPNKSGYVHVDDAIGAINDYHNQFNKSNSVDESVEERAKKERIIRQCVRAIPRPSMFGDKFNKLYEDSVANDKATHAAMSKYANECLKEQVRLDDVVKLIAERIKNIEGNGHTVLTVERVNELTDLINQIRNLYK